VLAFQWVNSVAARHQHFNGVLPGFDGLTNDFSFFPSFFSLFFEMSALTDFRSF
jgi:hypothetical protein